MNYANYGTLQNAQSYQDLLYGQARTVKRRARHGPMHRVRAAIARSLVLAGARIMPDTPAVIGDRVVVFDRAPLDDVLKHELQSAA